MIKYAYSVWMKSIFSTPVGVDQSLHNHYYSYHLLWHVVCISICYARLGGVSSYIDINICIYMVLDIMTDK